ncbi:hypothetical protein [Namhaeicola litoreus]|uniref:Uncharacterized protein n=1 Tax=Namhaeicola litoreus TaxID=1052145 RepID=A0ABW3Y6H5_9FLAO
MIRKIKVILAKDLIQRVLFGIGLILWTFINWNGIIKNPNSETSLGIANITLYLIPAIILLIQIIRNNKILWGLTFGLFTIYILTSLIMVISNAITRSGNHVKAIDWNVTQLIQIFVFFGVLGIIDWIIYQSKPSRLI